MEEGRGMDWAKTIGGRQKGFLLSPPSALEDRVGFFFIMTSLHSKAITGLAT